MSVSNFDELTPGNAMKHASVVANNGKMNFDAVMVCGADGYRLYMQPEYDYSRLAPKGVKETVFRNGIGLTGDVNLNIVVLEEQKDKSMCEKSYTFLWENSDDIKSYLLGYIRSDTERSRRIISPKTLC